MANAPRPRELGDTAPAAPARPDAHVDPTVEGRAAPSAEDSDVARRQRELLETDDKVWDLVYHLAHPTALYVLFQLLIHSHLGDTPALRGYHALDLVPLAIYGGQFLGAWAVLYTTLLRDMGHRCAPGTFLLIAALAGVVGQYFVFPEPRSADVDLTWIWIGAQLALALVAWPLVQLQWWRLKSSEPAA